MAGLRGCMTRLPRAVQREELQARTIAPCPTAVRARKTDCQAFGLLQPAKRDSLVPPSRALSLWTRGGLGPFTPPTHPDFLTQSGPEAPPGQNPPKGRGSSERKTRDTFPGDPPTRAFFFPKGVSPPPRFTNEPQRFETC